VGEEIPANQRSRTSKWVITQVLRGGGETPNDFKWLGEQIPAKKQTIQMSHHSSAQGSRREAPMISSDWVNKFLQIKEADHPNESSLKCSGERREKKIEEEERRRRTDSGRSCAIELRGEWFTEWKLW
jgi:hypothetical protein